MNIIYKIFSVAVVMASSFSGLCQELENIEPYSFKLTEEVSTLVDIPIIEMESFDIEAEKKRMEGSVPPIFAKPFHVDLDIHEVGQMTKIDEGTIWRLGVLSEHAFSLNFIFSKYNLNEGALMHMYNKEKTVLVGGFDSKFNSKKATYTGLACQPVDGDLIYLELFEPNETEKSELVIAKISHDFIGFNNLEKNDPNGPSGECNIDILCSVGDPWHKEKASVCLILLNGEAWCTGAMINNTNEDGRELLLTANHCYDFGSSESNGNAASNSVFRFNYESPYCDGPHGPTTMNISGSTIRSQWGPTDFVLMELSSQIPTSFYSYYSGWDRAFTIPPNTVGIHHPNGDDKMISFDDDPPQITGYLVPGTNCTQNPGNNYWKILDWNSGTTERGSSGSPLYNPDFRIIGQLRGGCAACGNNTPDYYGMLPVSWNGGGTASTRLKDLLDPVSAAPSDFLGLRCIRYYTVNHNAWFTGDVVKFHDVLILSGYNVVVTEMQDRFEATGTLDIQAGGTFDVY